MAIQETKIATGSNGTGRLKDLGDKVEIDKRLPLTVFLDDRRARDVTLTGGKGANLAELRTMSEIQVPDGFVITASLSEQVLQQNFHTVSKIANLDQYSLLWVKAKLNGDEEEAESCGEQISEGGKIIEKEMNSIKLSPEAENIITDSYNELCQKVGKENVRVAVRSSGICEDGSEFSFAGQNETFLHQQGREEVAESVIKCIASQFGARAIEYRNEARLKLARRSLKENENIENALAVSNSFSHAESRLAVVVQEMVDGEASGIAFSVDSKTGAPITLLDINYGLGEAIVSGSVTPDSYEVDLRTGTIIGRSLGEKAVKTAYVKGGIKDIKVPLADRKRFAVTDDVVKEIVRKIAIIKDHYDREIDTEFVVKDGEVILTQARPETIASNENPRIIKMREFVVPENIAKTAEVILRGGKMGAPGAATGKVIIANGVGEARRAFEAIGNRGKNLIWVTRTTSPDSVPWMKKTKGIATRIGGDKCHAAIVSRELRVPCIVGISKKIDSLKSGEEVTLDARNAVIYKGTLLLEEVGEDIDVREVIGNPTKTVLGINMANPDEAKRMHALAELGSDFKVSLLRAEFLLGEIGVHINALVDFDNGKIESGTNLYKKVARKIAKAGYTSGKEYFIAKYSEGISSIAAMFPNSDIVLRTTDFKTNEYKGLIGGSRYERKEENPMMGVRGLPRFLLPGNIEGFKWELEAIKNARDNGFKNIKIMFPMVRDPLELNGSPKEMEKGYGEGAMSAYDIMKEVGLERGRDGLKTLIMVENPANVFRLDAFIDAGIDEISIGSNDLTQLILGVDRDNEELAKISQFNEMNPAVIIAIEDVLRTCKRRGIKAGICGNAPSNYPEIVEMLIREGIDSIGITADRYWATHKLIREVEQNRNKQAAAASAPTVLFPAN